jgi:hypothetical protein
VTDGPDTYRTRPVQPDLETVITAGGKPAIRRGPLAKAVTVHTVGGNTVSNGEGMVPDNTVYVPLNKTDVLTTPRTLIHSGDRFRVRHLRR